MYKHISSNIQAKKLFINSFHDTYFRKRFLRNIYGINRMC